MTENKYQAKLIKTLEKRFPGCEILKTDSGFQQGIPDLIVLFNYMWAALEVKASADSKFQPNQEYYVDHLNHMSFAAVIYPENEAEVLDALQQAFEVAGGARIP